MTGIDSIYLYHCCTNPSPRVFCRLHTGIIPDVPLYILSSQEFLIFICSSIREAAVGSQEKLVGSADAMRSTRASSVPGVVCHAHVLRSITRFVAAARFPTQVWKAGVDWVIGYHFSSIAESGLVHFLWDLGLLYDENVRCIVFLFVCLFNGCSKVLVACNVGAL